VIVRPTGRDTLLLIRQPDHAALAADLISAWTDGALPANPRRDRIVAAARSHDDGWDEEDDAPLVGGDGEPVDFIAAPAEVKQRVWPRAIGRLAAADAYVAALVAQHALTVYDHYAGDPAWTTFFATLAASRARLLTRCEPAAAASLEADYPFVRAADLLSLAFCNGWEKPAEYGGHRITVTPDGLEVSPDPFSGRLVPFRVPARRIERRIYRDAADLRSVVTAAATEWIEGTARGVAVS
jgi:hypothetical protein